jgi:hypothetical protein
MGKEGSLESRELINLGSKQASKQTDNFIFFTMIFSIPLSILEFSITPVSCRKTQGVLMVYKNDFIFKIRYLFVTSEPIFINIKK